MDYADDLRRQFVEHVARMVGYWSELPGLSVEDRCDGVAFSVLVLLDGGAVLPRAEVLIEGVDISAEADLHDAYGELRRQARQ